MELKINQEVLKKLVDACKNSVSKNDPREECRFIKIKVEKDKVTAYSCDGYTASRTSVPLSNNEQEEFEGFIMPITVPAINDVATIETVDGQTSVEVATRYGALKYKFKHPNCSNIKYDEIFASAQDHDREIAFNAFYLAKACNAIKSVSMDKNNMLVLETRDSDIRPIILRAKEEWGETEQLVLPIRRAK